MNGSKYAAVVSKCAAVVSTLALSFQIFVLEPWHAQISKEINELTRKIQSSNTNELRRVSSDN